MIYSTGTLLVLIVSLKTSPVSSPVQYFTYHTCILETTLMKRSVQNLAFSRFSPNQATPWTFEHLSAKDYCTTLKSEYERDGKKWMCKCSRLVLAGRRCASCGIRSEAMMAWVNDMLQRTKSRTTATAGRGSTRTRGIPRYQHASAVQGQEEGKHGKYTAPTFAALQSLHS